MKKTYLLIILFFVFYLASYSQTVSTFESLTLTPNSYWNGSNAPMGTYFQDGHAIFPNHYDTAWGGFWQSGWAYSNMQDSITSGYLNMYSAITAVGVDSSTIYIIGTEGSTINLTTTALGKVVDGVYVSNSTYAALSMRDGDFVAKKFGGTNGNDPDWFKLTIKGYYQNVLIGDSVEFYLADYRFSNNSLDYIVNTWEWVDLKPLGNVDSLIFFLSSSDVGMYGMNTPAFFCLDNFTTLDVAVNISFIHPSINISVYPNPVSEVLYLDVQKAGMQCEIINYLGQTLLKQNIDEGLNNISIHNFAKGCYFVKIYDNTFSRVLKVVIN